MNSYSVSIIIINYNGANVILDCLRSITQFQESYSEIIVVDNASQDNSLDLIRREFSDIKLILQTQNLGFGTANNIGVKHASSEFIFLLNSDTILTDNIIPLLVDKLVDNPSIGIIAPRLLNQDNTFQFSISKEISLLGEFQTLQQVKTYRNLSTRSQIARQYDQPQSVDVVVGAAMLMRKTVFNHINGFDQSFFMYFEDSDLCKRVRDSGYRINYEPRVSLKHIGGSSSSKAQQEMSLEYRKSQRLYYKKHRPLWEQWILNIYLAMKRLKKN